MTLAYSLACHPEPASEASGLAKDGKTGNGKVLLRQPLASRAASEDILLMTLTYSLACHPEPASEASVRRRMAERVGFAPLLRIENKELTGFSLPHDPPDPLKNRGRDTY
jgi:hypothetical protein